ncbi:hypothetical protein C8J56DRAFT_900204 [Mycena floridula]|nr:hypothetical protein C8J56DRAFT_900204 [Mycena floridula]
MSVWESHSVGNEELMRTQVTVQSSPGSTMPQKDSSSTIYRSPVKEKVLLEIRSSSKYDIKRQRAMNEALHSESQRRIKTIREPASSFSSRGSSRQVAKVHLLTLLSEILQLVKIDVICFRAYVRCFGTRPTNQSSFLPVHIPTVDEYIGLIGPNHWIEVICPQRVHLLRSTRYTIQKQPKALC